MDSLLTKAVSELTSAEKKQLIADWSEKKDTVQFSSATIRDCIRLDGLNLNLSNVSRIQRRPSLHIPPHINAHSPSSFLCKTLERIDKVWVSDHEKACRIIIDAILTEVLHSVENEKLLGYCDVKNNWDGAGCNYTGNVDYMFGSSPDSDGLIDALILVVEAKNEWPDQALYQVLAEAGCLLKKRIESGKVAKKAPCNIRIHPCLLCCQTDVYFASLLSILMEWCMPLLNALYSSETMIAT